MLVLFGVTPHTPRQWIQSSTWQAAISGCLKQTCVDDLYLLCGIAPPEYGIKRWCFFYAVLWRRTVSSQTEMWLSPPTFSTRTSTQEGEVQEELASCCLAPGWQPPQLQDGCWVNTHAIKTSQAVIWPWAILAERSQKDMVKLVVSQSPWDWYWVLQNTYADVGI